MNSYRKIRELSLLLCKCWRCASMNRRFVHCLHLDLYSSTRHTGAVVEIEFFHKTLPFSTRKVEYFMIIQVRVFFTINSREKCGFITTTNNSDSRTLLFTCKYCSLTRKLLLTAWVDVQHAASCWSSLFHPQVMHFFSPSGDNFSFTRFLLKAPKSPKSPKAPKAAKAPNAPKAPKAPKATIIKKIMYISREQFPNHTNGTSHKNIPPNRQTIAVNKALLARSSPPS